MSKKPERELSNEIDEVKHAAGETDAPTDVTVEWHVPEEPVPGDAGITYNPETETLSYDLWDAQKRCLEALDSGHSQWLIVEKDGTVRSNRSTVLRDFRQPPSVVSGPLSSTSGSKLS